MNKLKPLLLVALMLTFLPGVSSNSYSMDHSIASIKIYLLPIHLKTRTKQSIEDVRANHFLSVEISEKKSATLFLERLDENSCSISSANNLDARALIEVSSTEGVDRFVATEHQIYSVEQPARNVATYCASEWLWRGDTYLDAVD